MALEHKKALFHDMGSEYTEACAHDCPLCELAFAWDIVARVFFCNVADAGALELAAQDATRPLKIENHRLTTRIDELLVTVRNLSLSTPYEEEAGSTAVLIAEVGTLKARVAELEREREEAKKQLGFIEHHGFTIAQTALGDLSALRRKMVWEIVWAARGSVPAWWPLKDEPT